MRKILFFIILLGSVFFLSGCVVNACGTDSECYEAHIQINSNNQSYFEYYYNGKIYNVKVPLYRSEFIYLENMYVSGRISEDNIYYNTMKLSVQLVVM
jgi:hypothetical protein